MIAKSPREVYQKIKSVIDPHLGVYVTKNAEVPAVWFWGVQLEENAELTPDPPRDLRARGIEVRISANPNMGAIDVFTSNPRKSYIIDVICRKGANLEAATELVEEIASKFWITTPRLQQENIKLGYLARYSFEIY